MSLTPAAAVTIVMVAAGAQMNAGANTADMGPTPPAALNCRRTPVDCR